MISIIGFTRSRRIICQAQALGLEHRQLGLRCRRARGPGGGDAQAACDRQRWLEMVSRLWFLHGVNTVVSKCAGPTWWRGWRRPPTWWRGWRRPPPPRQPRAPPARAPGTAPGGSGTGNSETCSTKAKYQVWNRGSFGYGSYLILGVQQESLCKMDYKLNTYTVLPSNYLKLYHN